MKKSYFLAGFVLISLISIVYASAEIIYPVSELGNCASQQACEIYCDDVVHMDACLDFAEKNNLMTADEIAEARKFAPMMKSGNTPGGCKGKECKIYCEDEAHIIECVDFAVRAGVIDAKEAEMVKKTGGKGPGGCKGKKQCDKFCEDEANFPTCVDFAVANGLMPASEAEMAKKTGGKGPGNCKGKEECDKFCNNPDNMETCTNFAIEHGLMSESELANMKKNQEFMNSAEGKCTTQCLKEAGVDSKSCGENGVGPEACRTCGDKCYSHDNEKCLSQERWQQIDADCKAKGSGYHLEEVKGDDGYGKECVIDETCVYSSGEEWESQEEKDRKMGEMEAQWAEERAKYESEHGPGGSENQGGSYEGGCTQPGPEGQCNPGPGAGSEDGGAGGEAGSGDSGSGGSDSGSGGESGSSTSSDSGGSGGDAGAVVTGSVISEQEGSGLISRIINFFSKITGKVVEEHTTGPSASEQQCMMTCMKCTSPGVGCTGNQQECMTQCNAKKPEATKETSCMETCVLVGCGELDFTCQEKNKTVCEKECDMIKEPPAKSEEEQCIRDCVNAEQEGLICRGGEGGEKGNELCQRCAKSCEHLYAGPCLTEMKLEAAKKECETCEHCYGKPVMGDSEEGYQCIVSIECADSSSEFGDEAGTGPGVGQEGFAAKVGDTIGNVFESIGNFFSNLFG